MTEENMDLNRQVELFLAAIREEGAKSCAEIQSRTDSETEAALAQAQQTEQVRAENSVRFESERITAQGNRQLSEGRAALRAELAARRADLQQQVFAAAEEKLKEFAAGDEYAAWLTASAQKVAALLGPGCTLYARTADVSLLQRVLPNSCALQADDTIHLGGVKGRSGTCAADDTLEARLAAQQNWFLEHSGLSIDF